MTKAEIVQALYSKVGGFSRKESAELVDLVFEMMKETLGRGEKIKVSGFGNFVLRDKRQRPGATRRRASRSDQRAPRAHVQGEPDPQAGAQPARPRRGGQRRRVDGAATAPSTNATASAKD